MGSRKALLALALLFSSCMSDGSIGPGDVLTRSSFFVGTDTVPQGVFESELALAIQSSQSLGLETAVAYGATETTELQARLLAYRFDSSEDPELEGVGDLSVGLVQGLRPEQSASPSLAMEFVVDLPVRSDDDPLRSSGANASLALIASKWLEETYTSATLSAAALDGSSQAALDVSGQLDVGLARNLNPWSAMFLGLTGTFDSIDEELVPSLSVGLAFAFGERTILDLGASFELGTGEQPVLATAWTWAY